MRWTALLGLALPWLAAAAPPQILWPPAGGVVHTGYPSISGMAEPGQRIAVELDGTVLGTAITGLAGTWSIPLWSGPSRTPLAPGPHLAVASEANAGASDPRSFTVSDGPPDAPIVLVPVEDSQWERQELVFAGTAEADYLVEISVDGAFVDRADPYPFGFWSFRPAVPPDRGHHSVTAVVSRSGHASESVVGFTVLGDSYFTYGCSAATGRPWALPVLLTLLGHRRRSWR